ncbi:MAG TPA: hypothetical protein VMN03_01495 [Burkholderiales bacterium]|nr:hypothetical protein [Burkholderiales bacterium]
MGLIFSLAAASAILLTSLLLAPGASAMTAGTAPGLQLGAAETNAVERVRRVCRHRAFTSRRHCYIDRSGPPTVCHHIRRTSRQDCY